jgi:hypothetical protein
MAYWTMQYADITKAFFTPQWHIPYSICLNIIVFMKTREARTSFCSFLQNSLRLNNIVDSFLTLNKLDKKYWKYGQKTTFALKKGTAFTAPIFWDSQPLNKVYGHLRYQIPRLFLSNGSHSVGFLYPLHLTILDTLSETFFSDQDAGCWEHFRSFWNNFLIWIWQSIDICSLMISAPLCYILAPAEHNESC